MEKLTLVLIPIFFSVVLLRLLLLPVTLACKLLMHSSCGFLCLWMLNLVAPFTGIFLPVTLGTLCVAGLFGLPGIVLLLLAIL